MFLSIGLELKSDQEMLRFVWSMPGQPIKHYRMITVTFGLISSPHQAISCLRDTAIRLQTVYPEAAMIILICGYMDDIASGAKTVQEGKRLIMEILVIMASGGFKGHKISASDPAMLEGLPDEQVDHSRIVSVLGLKLDHDSSEFLFDLDEKFQSYDANANRITRRDVVSLASQIFDTQGFVSPYVMQYKKLLPLLWHNNKTWDENLIDKKVKSRVTSFPTPLLRKPSNDSGNGLKTFLDSRSSGSLASKKVNLKVSLSLGMPPSQGSV